MFKDIACLQTACCILVCIDIILTHYTRGESKMQHCFSSFREFKSMVCDAEAVPIRVKALSAFTSSSLDATVGLATEGLCFMPLLG